MGTPVRKTLASCVNRCTTGDEGGVYVCASYVLVHLHQQIIEITTINFIVIRAKTMTNFWNMSNASAPMHPHHSCQCEVVNKERQGHTTSIDGINPLSTEDD